MASWFRYRLGTLVRIDDPLDKALRTHVAFVMYQIKDFVPLCMVKINASGVQEAARLSQLRNELGLQACRS